MRLRSKRRRSRLRASLPERIADYIREGIIEGGLAPGQRLTETAVASELGVSNIPVREAFQQLEQEGLINKEQRYGSFVREFTDEDVRHLFQARTPIDSLAYRIMIDEDKLDAGDFEYLQDTLDEQRQAIKDGDFATLVDLDLAFHDFIYEKTASDVLLGFWNVMRNQCRVLFYWRFQDLAHHVPETVLDGHATILEGLRTRDLTSITRHIESVHQGIGQEIIQVLHGRRDDFS
jgi:DNA-binding GntR family transcriptional regulator